MKCLYMCVLPRRPSPASTGHMTLCLCHITAQTSYKKGAGTLGFRENKNVLKDQVCPGLGCDAGEHSDSLTFMSCPGTDAQRQSLVKKGKVLSLAEQQVGR
ncbi:hypothetical protein JZ751_010725 [Albula glossodonta]|uniref:Uncharacterized protein n=1 Tax=Albula glossodonta TaxID=121402 RepID=A0A8T2MM98_9TELE|nr:hypothetical protein JZ751_007667 [Albula glossodonta]KAG9333656.1 hypothetical protein JZ751_010725 [Albula glossodonta]